MNIDGNMSVPHIMAGYHSLMSRLQMKLKCLNDRIKQNVFLMKSDVFEILM